MKISILVWTISLKIPHGLFFTLTTLGLSYSKMHSGRRRLKQNVILFPLDLNAMRSTLRLRKVLDIIDTCNRLNGLKAGKTLA